MELVLQKVNAYEEFLGTYFKTMREVNIRIAVIGNCSSRYRQPYFFATVRTTW